MRLKRIVRTGDRRDGVQILVDRLWLRGASKSDAADRYPYLLRGLSMDTPNQVCVAIISQSWRLDGMFVILSLASGSDARPECPAAHAARFGGKSSPVADTHHVIPQKRLFVFFFRKQRSERISRIDDSQRFGILVDDGDVYEATLLHRRQDIG
jgi:hypothetical protein